MKKTLSRGVAAVAGAAVAVVLFGSGSASANNEYKGLTYEKAAASIKRWGTPVISSRTGSFLPTPKCVITGSRSANFLDGSGRKQQGRQVLLDLNCNAPTAAEGHPGNSIVTPEGKKAKTDIKQAIALSANFDKATAQGKEPTCGRDEPTRNYCVRICTNTGKCSDGLEDYLGL